MRSMKTQKWLVALVLAGAAGCVLGRMTAPAEWVMFSPSRNVVLRMDKRTGETWRSVSTRGWVKITESVAFDPAQPWLADPIVEVHDPFRLGGAQEGDKN